MLERAQLLCAAGALAFLVPIGAAGLTIDPNPRTFTNGTDIGTITLVGTATGDPSGGCCVLAGTVGASDITLIFEVTVTGGVVESLGVGAVDTVPAGLVNSTGAGWLPGNGTPGNEPDTLANVTSVTGTAGNRIFDFDADGNLNTGQTSNYFFVSYASLEDDETQKINFMVNGSTGSDFTVQVTLVPEPALLALLGLGLGALGLSLGRATR